jgi:hypothetical protein
MKTIQQQTQVTFSAIEVKDAVKATILMDALKYQLEKWEQYNTYNNLSEEEKENTRKVWEPDRITIQITEEQTKALFELFENLGFCTSY